jgi:hypothetical protein
MEAMSVQVCYEHVSEQGNELYELVSIHLMKRKKNTCAYYVKLLIWFLIRVY